MRPTRPLAWALGSLIALSGASLTGPVAAVAVRASERIHVTVVDARGRPVTGLTAADFEVRLDNQPQEVVSAAATLEPASVMIVTDRLGLNSTYTAFDVGQTLKGFTAAIRKGHADSKLALTTIDGIVLSVTKFTDPAAGLDRALGRLASNAGDAALLDGLAEVCNVMRTAPTERRVIFTLLAAYRADQSNVRVEQVIDMLRASGASLWVVEARQAQGGNFGNPAREQVLDYGSRHSGGLREIVASRSGVTAATTRIADLILAQYALTYGPAGGSIRSEVVVTVKRPGLRVLAASWVAR
jgi:hypothetical protein